jgi:hypothetical protein
MQKFKFNKYFLKYFIYVFLCFIRKKIMNEESNNKH